MKRSTKKQNYRLFMEYFSEELTKQTGSTLKDGYAELITKDAAYRFDLNRPEFWHRAMKYHVESILPSIKSDCFKEPNLKELLLSRMNSSNTYNYETPDEVKKWLDDDSQW